MKQFIPFIVVVLSGCTNASHESVSIRWGNIACDEHMEFDRTGSLNTHYANYGENITADVDLSFPVSSYKVLGPHKRCQDILELAKQKAEIKADLENERLRLQNERLRLSVAYLKNENVDSDMINDHIYHSE